MHWRFADESLVLSSRSGFGRLADGPTGLLGFMDRQAIWQLWLRP